MILIERDGWVAVERQRVDNALQRAWWWQVIEPHKCEFWAVFDNTVLANYPKCRFRQDEQVTLGDFGGASV